MGVLGGLLSPRGCGFFPVADLGWGREEGGEGGIVCRWVMLCMRVLFIVDRLIGLCDVDGVGCENLSEKSIICGRKFCRKGSRHVFSRMVAAVDTKRGYVGMCNGRSAQQESGTS